MANPSLQIGNSNWAIKEDDLLGYSTVGTNYLPKPMTMTRASAGTRVNPQGLVETVELLGSEEVSCGNFECANPNGVWNRGTGWGISGGTATYDGSGGTQPISQSIANIQLGTFCKVTIDVLSNQGGGNNTIFLGGTVVQESHLDVGSYTFYGSFTSNTNLYIYGRSGEVFEIDNISVKEVTRDGLARVDYTDGTSSLLVEPQRTNLIKYSSDFSNAIWTKSGSSVTLNATTSPDGTINADKLVEDTSTGGHQIQSITSSSNSTIYTTSVFVKYAGREWIRFTDAQSSNRIHFNTLTGVFGTVSGTVIDYNKTALENGWYKLSLTTTSVATAYTPRIALAEADNDVSYTGDGVSGVYIYGCSLEEGSYPTSLIPTSGGTVTRVQETYTKTGISNLINSEEGVLFLEVSALALTSTLEMLSLSDGTYNNVVLFRYYDTSSNDIQVQVKVAGSTQASMLFTLTDATDFNKIAFKYKENDFALWVNGTEVATDTSGNTFTSGTLNKFSFDRGDGSNPLFSKVKQLQVFKTALSNSELATLTS
jgi:hypothetical protein